MPKRTVMKRVPFPFRSGPAVCRDGGPDGRMIVVGGWSYVKGLSVRARTELVYRLDGKYASFQARVGACGLSGRERGRVRFLVYADSTKGKLLFSSDKLSTDARDTAEVKVDVGGVANLVLVTDRAKDSGMRAWGGWAGARLVAK